MGAAAVTRGAVSRRAFLESAGRTGLGAVALSLGGGSLLPRTGAALPGAVRSIELEARELTWELTPGRRVKAMAYNGRIPGPEIRLKEGERARIVLKNALAEPTTIHWHGVDVPNPMDGCRGSRRSGSNLAGPSSTRSRPGRPAPGGTTRTSTSIGRWTSAWPRR